jgi:transcriptional regulator with XRE-family HTH domain
MNSTATTMTAQAPEVATNVFNWQQHRAIVAEPMVIPQATAPTEPAVEEPDEHASPAAVSNPFAGLTDRAAVPAANDDVAEDDDVADDDGETSNHVSATRDPRRGDANRKLRRIVGPRLTRARALSGFSQTEAATAFGYRTPAQVSLWEMGRRLPPIFEVIKAARLYGVSLDYIVGESHETDRDPSAGARHAILRGVRGMLENVAQITIGEVDRHVRLVGPHVNNVRALLESGDALLEAFGVFVRHNQGAFSNQRSSATLQRRAEEFEASLASARTAIRLHDARDADLARALAALGEADPLLAEDDES